MTEFCESLEIAEGIILVLSGLSRTELNGQFVEVEEKKVKEDGTYRWQCFNLASKSRLAVKESNLALPPEPTREFLSIKNELCRQASQLFQQAMQTIRTDSKK